MLSSFTVDGEISFWWEKAPNEKELLGKLGMSSEPRTDTVPAEDILNKMRNGNPVCYENVSVVGDLNRVNLTDSLCGIESNQKGSNGLETNSQIRIIGAKFRGSVNFKDFHFKKPVEFVGVDFSNDISFESAVFDDYVSFIKCSFGENPSFLNTRFNDSVYFKNSNFNKMMPWRFDKTHFGGTVSFYKNSGIFYFRDAKFKEETIFRSEGDNFYNFLRDSFEKKAWFIGNFKGNGGSGIKESIFEDFSTFDCQFDNFSFDKNEFKNLNIIRCKLIKTAFNGNILFSNPSFLNVIFIDIEFNNNNFQDAIYFKDTKFNGNASINNNIFHDVADFSGVLFNGNTSINNNNFQGDAIFNDATFNKNCTLSLTRTGYNKLYLRWDQIRESIVYDETAYLLLIDNFKKLGFSDDANECFYQYRDQKRSTIQGIYGFLDTVLKLVYGYGVRPERTVAWSIFAIVVFGLIFWRLKGIDPILDIGLLDTEEERTSLKEAVYFSGQTFLSGTKLFIDPPKFRVNGNIPIRIVALFRYMFVLERIMGMLAFFLFVIAISNRVNI